MNKLKQITLIVMSIFILVLPACSHQEEKQTGEEEQSVMAENSQVQKKGSLKLYFYEKSIINKEIIEAAIIKFNLAYPDVYVERVGFEDTDEYAKKVSTELMGGGGPDILQLQPSMNMSFIQVMESGALADINNILKNELDFNIDDYYKVVIDCGVYKGKRYFVPLSFSVNFFLTTEELLSRNGLYIDPDNWTLKNLVDQLVKLNKSIDGEKKVYLNCNIPTYGNIIFLGGQKFVDYKNKKAYYNTPEFIEILDAYEVLEDIYLPEDVRNKYKNIFIAMKDGVLLSDDTRFKSNPSYLWADANYINYYVGTDVKLYPLPAWDGSTNYTAIPGPLVAINEQCQDKQLAFDFIKVLLSEDIQKQMIDVDIPVNP